MFDVTGVNLWSWRVAALAILVALGGSLGSGARAKHSPMKEEPDQEVQQSSAPDDQSPAGPGGKATMIQGEFVESHDLLDEANDPSSPQAAGIRWSHKFAVTLSGKKDVREKWSNERISRGALTPGATSRHSGPINYVVTSRGESSAVIGENSGRAVWHVLGDRKLERIFPGQHFLMMMNIEVSPDKSCHLDVKYLRQVGFVSVVMKKATTGEMANFSLPRVESASCTIQ